MARTPYCAAPISARSRSPSSGLILTTETEEMGISHLLVGYEVASAAGSPLFFGVTGVGGTTSFMFSTLAGRLSFVLSFCFCLDRPGFFSLSAAVAVVAVIVVVIASVVVDGSAEVVGFGMSAKMVA